MPVSSDRFQQCALEARALLLALCLASTSASPRSHATLQSQIEGQASSAWAVKHSDVQSTLTGTMLSLEIRNISAKAEPKATFYAEYLDEAGRICLTALFSGNRNAQKHTGVFPAGETRLLYTGTAYLYPAVKPVRVKIWPLAAKLPQASRGEEPAIPSIKVPPVLKPSSMANKLWLDTATLGKAQEPIADLLLATVQVNSDGTVGGVRVIQRVNSGVESWFRDFIRHREFQPEQVGGQKQPSSVLILVRAIVSLRCVHQKAFPPYTSTLVQGYVPYLKGQTMPVLTTLLLMPLSHEYPYRRMPHSAFFTDPGVGAGWAPVTDVREEAVVSKPGPVLQRFTAPPGSEGCP